MGGLQPRDEGYRKPGVPDTLKWAPVMRGFPEGTDILTDVGWISFEKLFKAGRNGTRTNPTPLFGNEVDVASMHIPLKEEYAKNKSKFQTPYAFGKANTVDYTRWNVRDDFPAIATLSPEALSFSHKGNSRIVFVKPEFAFRFSYDNHQLVHLKKRGIDLVVPRFADVFNRPKFRSTWDFATADDFCVTRSLEAASYRSVVNRYSPVENVYGDVDVDEMLELSESGNLFALTEKEYVQRILANGKDAQRKRIWDVFEYPAVRDPATGRFIKAAGERNTVECYNIVLPKHTSHTVIVRRERKKKTGARKGEWVGEPIVMGDGYDKSQIRIDKLEGGR